MPKSKSLFKRVIGDWSDLKRGTKMGASIRQKPLKWVERQASKMDSSKAELALKKFKRRAKLALLVIFAVWVPVSVWGARHEILLNHHFLCEYPCNLADDVHFHYQKREEERRQGLKQYYVKNKLNHEARWQEAESELDACIKLGWDSRDCEVQQRSKEELAALVTKEGQKPTSKWLIRLGHITQILAGITVILQTRVLFSPDTELAEVKGLARIAFCVAYIAFVELFLIRRKG